MNAPTRARYEVRRLSAAGLNVSQIARRTAIPRATVRGWIEGRVPEVTAEEARCSQCGHPEHELATLPAREYAYLLGFYLGDGTISAGRKGVHALRISSDQRYAAVLAECALAVTVVMPRNRVGFVQKAGCVEIVATSKSWPCLFPQYGRDRKHERRIELTDWQADIVGRRPHQFVRGLLHSDGCRITNFATSSRYGRYEYPRYLFSNASADIRTIFCDALRRLGVEHTHPRERVVSIARAASVRLLDEFVGPKA